MESSILLDNNDITIQIIVFASDTISNDLLVIAHIGNFTQNRITLPQNTKATFKIWTIINGHNLIIFLK